MKAARLIAFILFLTSSGMWCMGQVRVTGHVSAEVVESISASSNCNIDMTFNAPELKNFELGSFSVSSNASSTCTLIVDKVNVSNRNGESFALETTIPGSERAMVADQNGNHSLTLNAGREELLANGQYQGNYGVTFAYN